MRGTTVDNSILKCATYYIRYLDPHTTRDALCLKHVLSTNNAAQQRARVRRTIQSTLNSHHTKGHLALCFTSPERSRSSTKAAELRPSAIGRSQLLSGAWKLSTVRRASVFTPTEIA
jgi:hypothetical protein